MKKYEVRFLKSMAKLRKKYRINIFLQGDDP